MLSLLVRKVYTNELIEPLALQARERLQRLGYLNVAVRAHDGWDGWPEHSPYDGIIVTAAATHIPRPLVDQLAPGGRMAIPVGLPYSAQELMLVRKDTEGKIHVREILGVAFVPLQEDTAGDELS